MKFGCSFCELHDEAKKSETNSNKYKRGISFLSRNIVELKLIVKLGYKHINQYNKYNTVHFSITSFSIHNSIVHLFNYSNVQDLATTSLNGTTYILNKCWSIYVV